MQNPLKCKFLLAPELLHISGFYCIPVEDGMPLFGKMKISIRLTLATIVYDTVLIRVCQ